MSDVFIDEVNIHLKQLEQIGVLEVEKSDVKRFKLNSHDERVLALGLIETSEYLRKYRDVL